LRSRLLWLGLGDAAKNHGDLPCGLTAARRTDAEVKLGEKYGPMPALWFFW
jgi:hypothetical protein